jgi:type I restriction enzyme M protein
MTSNAIVQKLWNYCNILRDDGLSYQDYLEQLTFLLFLKMADERQKLLPSKTTLIPRDLDWQSLERLDGEPLDTHYRHILLELGKKPGMLGTIFRKAQNRVQDPAKLKRLVSDLIGREQWTTLGVDVKGDAYEGLLEKNAADVKGGAGQYFTPRALIQAIVDVMQPQPGQMIHDPACGTGGFLLAVHDHISNNYTLDKDDKRFLKEKALSGTEIVDSTARLCVMNLFLHGIGGEEPVTVADALGSKGSREFDMVLTNPPFGKKSSITVIGEDGDEQRETLSIVRDDFWATTSNKQLNFVQHVRSVLKIDGRTALVVPDNVLFEGGAGEQIRRRLLHDCDVHTLLRLPTGIFYAQGVKANVMFFDRRVASEKPWTKKLWIYDFRTNEHFTLKTNPLRRENLDDFVACFRADNRHKRKETERFKAFSYDELVKRDKASLDIFWLKDDSLEDAANLPAPDVIAAEIVEDLQAALDEFALIADDLRKA